MKSSGSDKYNEGREFGMHLCRWEHSIVAETSLLKSDTEKIDRLRGSLVKEWEEHEADVNDIGSSFCCGMLFLLEEKNFGLELCRSFRHLRIQEHIDEAARTIYFNAEFGEETSRHIKTEKGQHLLKQVIALWRHVDRFVLDNRDLLWLAPISNIAFLNWLECHNQGIVVEPALSSYCIEQEEALYHRAQVFSVFEGGAKLHGTAREVVVSEFVKSVMPPSLHLVAGQIVDASMKKKAGEHDIILTNSPQMLPLGGGFSLISDATVECILEVKSMGVLSEVKKAISQLRKFHEIFTPTEDGSQNDYPLLGIVCLKEHSSIEDICKELKEANVPIAFVAVVNLGVVCRYDLMLHERTASSQYVCLRKPGAFTAILIASLSGRTKGNTIWNDFLKLETLSFWTGGSSDEEQNCWKAIENLNQQAQRYNSAGLKEAVLVAIDAFLQQFPASVYAVNARRMAKALQDQQMSCNLRVSK